MSGHNYPNVRQALIQWQPASIKQFVDLTGVAARHPGCWWMGQHALDLGMLQELIASAPRQQVDPCQYDLHNHGCIAILSIEPDQGHFWWESEVLQIGGDGLQCRGQLVTIVAIAAICVGADPLTSMHLKSGRARADHPPRLRPR